MSVLTYIVAGLVMISVVVVIHEFGHFIVARYFGVGTPVFSVGMGPRLFGVTYKDTDFRVAALPIGGYVQMSGADPFGEEDANSWCDPELDFMKKPVWQRLLIMLAGPAMNIALPFVVFTLAFMAGDTMLDNVVARVLPATPAEEAGLQPGDAIVAVDGEPVVVWDDVVAEVGVDRTEPVVLTVDRDGERIDVRFDASAVLSTPDGRTDMERLGLAHYPHSSRVDPGPAGSAARRAGLQTGDYITHVDGAEVDNFDVLMAQLGDSGTHELSVKRADGESTSEHTLTLVSDGGEWGIEPLELVIGTVEKDSAADEAGLEPDDRFLSFDGTPVYTWPQVIDAVSTSLDGVEEGEAPRSLTMEVMRRGERVELAFAPRMKRQLIRGEPVIRPVLGVRQYPDAYAAGGTVVKHFGPVEAFSRATSETVGLVQDMGRMLGHLVTTRVKVTEGLGGPVAIVQAAGLAAELGWIEFAKMMGRISLGIGILNLLPVPVLDGGQILFYLLEGLRGRPLPLVLRERILMVGILMVAALLLVVTVSDVGRVLGS